MSGPSGLAQDPLPERRARGALDHRPVEQQHPDELHLQGPVEVASHQLVGDRGPHVVGDEEELARRRRVAADELLDQVGLPVQRVDRGRAASRRARSRGSPERARACSVSSSSSSRQSYELDGKPWRKSRSGPPPPRSKTWMRRPRNSSSLPRSRQAATRVDQRAIRTQATAPPRAPRARDDEPAGAAEVVALPGGVAAPPCRRLESLQIPGVELAQVAGGALGAEVLLGTVHHPEQLRDHLLAIRLVRRAAGQLLEDPRVAERPAGDHHRVGAGGLVGVRARPRPCRGRRR